jgi:signal transduction histidine kinase
MKIPGWVPSSIHTLPSAKRDAALLPALYLFNFFVFSSWPQLGDVATEPWLILVWLYGLAVLVPLAWRDRAPVAVFIIQWVLTLAAWPIMLSYTPVIGIPVALYAVAVHRSGKISLLALLASIILDIAIAFRVDSDLAVFIANTMFLVIMAGGAWGAGRVTRAIQRHVESLERERERTREAEVVAAERRRIARELHDIVSHAVTVIVVQAAGAARVANTNFPQVIQSLEHIETTGKQAMAELRRLLRVLDESDHPSDAAGDGKLRPQPGLEDLIVLITSLRANGMPVTMHLEGTPRNLDPGVDLIAYRIAEEGLTNAFKHAGKDSNPRLQLIWEAGSLRIQVDNDTTLAQAHRGQGLSAGRGLMGLQERVNAIGGRLHSGPHNGGYRLTATIPLEDTSERMLLDHKL